MSTPGGSLDAVRSQIGLAHLPLELLRKIAREFSARSHLQAFSLVCRSTLAPARELLFDTLTLSNPGVSLLSSAHLLIGKSRLFPFPDLVRRLVLSREMEVLSLSPVDLAVLLHDFPNARTLDVSGKLEIAKPHQTYRSNAAFDNVSHVKLKTSDQDHAHETLRVLVDLCRSVVELDVSTDLLTLEDPFPRWHWAPARCLPSAVVLSDLRRLVLRSPVYLSFPTMNIISRSSLVQIRALEVDFTEESVGRTWYTESTFPSEFFEFFGSSIEHVYFNFPLFAKRSNVESLEGVLSSLTSLRTLSLASIGSGAAHLLIGLPRSCKDIIVHNEGGAPDWMGLARFFLEHEGSPALERLKGTRIWIDHSDCRFCDENFQREVESQSQKLGIQIIIAAVGGEAGR